VRRPSKERVAAGVLASEMLCAAVLGAVIVRGPEHPQLSRPASTAVAASTPVATSAPTSSQADATVPSAPPTNLHIPAIGVDVSVSPYTAAEASRRADGVTGKPCLVSGVITCVNPASVDSVVWQVGGVAGVAFGSEPGTDASGTVYFYGHAATGADAVFNDIARLKPGDIATVTTANGELHYQVQRTVDPAKSAFASTSEVVDQVPGRLLLISCDHGPGAKLVNGGYSTGNIVVVLQLEQQ